MKCFTDKRELSSMKWATKNGNNIGFNETNKKSIKIKKNNRHNATIWKHDFIHFSFMYYQKSNTKITNIRELTKIEK